MFNGTYMLTQLDFIQDWYEINNVQKSSMQKEQTTRLIVNLKGMINTEEYSTDKQKIVAEKLFKLINLDFMSDWYSLHKISRNLHDTFTAINKLRGELRDNVEKGGF